MKQLPKTLLLGFLCGIILSPSFAYAQSPEVEKKLGETKQQLQELVQLKDSTTLPVSEKEQQEIELRKTILGNVLDIAQSQLRDISTQLDSVIFPDSEEWKSVKKYLQDKNTSFLSFYSSQRTEMQAATSVAMLKDIAKNIEKEKTEEIDSHIRRVTTVMNILSIDTILSLGDARREKIKDDIEKIYTQKLVQDNELRNLFNKASTSLSQAHELANIAKQIVLHLYTETSTSTLQFKDDLKKTIVQERNEQLRQTAPPYTIYTVSDITSNDTEAYLRSIIRQSAQSVQSAYDIFLQMSLLVRGYLN